jgi:hypothetical protein
VCISTVLDLYFLWDWIGRFSRGSNRMYRYVCMYVVCSMYVCMYVCIIVCMYVYVCICVVPGMVVKNVVKMWYLYGVPLWFIGYRVPKNVARGKKMIDE